jgi:CDP-paratose 2-epimerase
MNRLPRDKREAKRTHAEQQEFILENARWFRRRVLYNRFQVTKSALVTGSCGLIGSEVSLHLARHGFRVSGIDNNQRAVFFGPEGDTSWSLERLRASIPGYTHLDMDIRDRSGMLRLVNELRPQVIVHTAAQPSHDRAAAIPFDDFDTNATGTLNLLEAARRACPESPFVHMSTNKVYGDLPNTIRLRELETRWDYDDPNFENGIPETFSIDHSKHSLFGASKVAADIMVQEYGRYFGMPTCCLRGGCLTGPNHSGVELHGFLSYLVRCNLEDREYKVYGYKGKQVRDNIHSEDVANFMLAFCDAPRCGEVYNLGGGKENSCSILEAFATVEELTGNPQRYTYIDQNRIGDHICYYSDLRKMKEHYPGWEITRPLPAVFREIVDSWQVRLGRLSEAVRE